MNEMKSLTLNGVTYDSFIDQTARKHPVTSVNGKTEAVELDAPDVRAVSYNAQSLNKEQKAQARENIGALAQNELQSGINTALTQAKESGEFDGKPGKDGTSVTHSWNGTTLTVTSASGTSSADLKGEPGPAGSTPVKGVDYFTDADKAEMVEDVLDAMDGVPSYWQTALDEGVGAINTAVESAGRNKSAFFFYTDAHWGYGSGMSPTLLKYMYKHTGINKTIFGGDFGNTYEHPDTGKTMDDWMNVMRSWKLAVRDIPNHHSVVGNHDKDIDAISTDKGLYGFLFAPEESNDIVRGGDFFYYIDDVNEKTRYFYLNTGLCNFSDEQCAFLIEGLTSVPSGWHIVVASHIWFAYDDDATPTVGSVPTNIQKVLNLLDAYNLRATGSMTIDSEAHAYDFSSCKGWVEFCIGGHTHVDYSFTSNNGIPVILCQTDSYHCRSNYTSTEGTTTESSVSGIVADYDAKKISVVRVGRGESREVKMTWYEVNYTNVLSLAIGNDGQLFQGGKGYAEDSRMGSGGLYIGTAPGMDCTGFIPIDPTVDQVIRFKNVTMKTDSSNKNNIAIALWSESFARLNFLNVPNFIDATNGARFNLVLDGTNITQITFPKSDITSGTKYIAICCDDINDASIITINEPID